MKAMKWILGAVVATAILAPLQSANAWGGDPYGEGDPYQSYRAHYRGDGYYGGYRGYYRGHRSYYGRHGYYRGHGYYRQPWYGYRGPVVVVPPPPPPPFPW